MFRYTPYFAAAICSWSTWKNISISSASASCMAGFRIYDQFMPMIIRTNGAVPWMAMRPGGTWSWSNQTRLGYCNLLCCPSFFFLFFFISLYLWCFDLFNPTNSRGLVRKHTPLNNFRWLVCVHRGSRAAMHWLGLNYDWTVHFRFATIMEKQI